MSGSLDKLSEIFKRNGLELGKTSGSMSLVTKEDQPHIQCTHADEFVEIPIEKEEITDVQVAMAQRDHALLL